jgi:DNA-binding transcriptional LysR family regulator
MDRLGDIEIFVTIVDAGSISLAAERLDMGKSAVSRRLSNLESRLGVQLLNRTTRRFDLTDEGRELYQSGRTVLADVDNLEGSVSAGGENLKGRIRVTAPLFFGLEYIRPVAIEFMTVHREVRIDVEFGSRHVDLVHEGFDLAVRVGELSDSSLIARKIAPVRHIACASPHYWNENGRPRTPQDLTGHAFLRYTGTADTMSWYKTDEPMQEGKVNFAPTVNSNNGEYLCDAAIAGLGFAILPSFNVDKAVERGALECVLTNYNWADMNLYAVYPPTRHLSNRTRAFIDYLIAHMAGFPHLDRLAR